MIKTLVRRLLERLFKLMSPRGEKFIGLIKFDLFKDVYQSTLLSMKEYPEQWQELVTSIDDGPYIPTSEDHKRLYILMDGSKYFTVPKQYKIVNVEKEDPFKEMMDDEGKPDKSWH